MASRWERAARVRAIFKEWGDGEDPGPWGDTKYLARQMADLSNGPLLRLLRITERALKTP